MIREEIGDAPFCILVDEALDESKKEQMAIILRFVNEDGILLERFFEILGVKDTSSATLKTKINDSLVRYNLNFQNMRGQGYDGASNMLGQWNGLQALFLRDCPYAYYVHCFAHRLQLALVAAAKDDDSVWRFFSHLTNVVNIVCSSDPEFQQISSLCELCRQLVVTKKSNNYRLIVRLIRLVLTLPVSTTTTERAFSAMKQIKTALRNKMEDEFLGDCMTLNIERELAMKIDFDSVIDEFYVMKPRRVQLK